MFKEAIKKTFASSTVVSAVEIGCLDGKSAKTLLSSHDNLNLVSIDPFIPDSMEASLIGSMALAIERNQEDYNNKRFNIIEGYSWNVVSSFPDGSCDVLFIDGDHRYDSVLRDVILYTPKLRKGGLLFTHDCRMNRPGGATFHKGPSRVADELLFSSKDWTLLGEAFSLACFKKG